MPTGPTYHDIGMIWGARLLSPTGLFAAENADVSSGRPSSRHLVFLTDGETAPRDIAYSAYGIEPLDQRRWQPGSAFTLTQTVENRFSYVCDEVKKKNVTVWVIGFGTAPNPVLRGLRRRRSLLRRRRRRASSTTPSPRSPSGWATCG